MKKMKHKLGAQHTSDSISVLMYKDKDAPRVWGIYTSGGKKPPNEGKSALAILSVFTHITIVSYHKIPLGSDAMNKS